MTRIYPAGSGDVPRLPESFREGEADMKCPNCGLEVVIATDMCPQCGYKYSFDGSIPPRAEPQIRQSGESVHRERRKEKKWRVSDSDSWTRAGVYNDDAAWEESTGRSRENSAKGMRWYNAVVNIILPITLVYYLYRCVTMLGTIVTWASMSSWHYYLPSTLGLLQIVAEAVYIICVVAAFAAMRQLKRFRWRGVMLYIAVIMVPACVNLVSQVIWMTYVGYYYPVFSYTVQFLAAVAYTVATAVYFARRREMFS